MRNWAMEMFSHEGIDSPRINAEELYAHCLGLSRRHRSAGLRPLSDNERNVFRSLVERRLEREPLQQIIGHWGFWSLDLRVTKDVMVPRPETEFLVEEALRLAGGAGGRSVEILDLGTGSGNVGISLARDLPGARIVATDISPEAIAVAADNARQWGVEDRVRFLTGDLFQPVGNGRFDLIVSNPPYIPTAEIETLDPEVRCFEPRIALDGGADGLYFYRRIARKAADHLRPGGSMLLELGDGQAGDVARLLTDHLFTGFHLVPDLRGVSRVIAASAPPRTEKAFGPPARHETVRNG